MDTRELSIMIGQCINLAHAEAMQQNFLGEDINNHIKKRVPELLVTSVELRKELRYTK